MKLTSLRIITADIKTLVPFFEQVTGTSAQWYTDDFAELSPARPPSLLEVQER